MERGRSEEGAVLKAGVQRPLALQRCVSPCELLLVLEQHKNNP